MGCFAAVKRASTVERISGAYAARAESGGVSGEDSPEQIVVG